VFDVCNCWCAQEKRTVKGGKKLNSSGGFSGFSRGDDLIQLTLTRGMQKKYGFTFLWQKHKVLWHGWYKRKCPQRIMGTERWRPKDTSEKLETSPKTMATFRGSTQAISLLGF